MKPQTNHKADSPVKQIRSLLQKEYLANHPEADVDVYRYNSASIRIRIVDPGFADLDLVERDDAIWRILKALPDQVRSEITLLLLLAPGEREKSLMNREFEDPTPSRL